MRDFKTGACYAFHIRHADGSLVVIGTANIEAGALASAPGDLLYLGVGGAGLKNPQWRERYWTETVVATGARKVRPVHWDAFWRPLSKPLAPLPRRLDRLDVTMEQFGVLAGRDGVDFALPRLWQRDDVESDAH